MDTERHELDYILLDTGGQVVSSSIDTDSEAFHDDIIFVINKINPAIENVKVQGLSYAIGPSGTGLISAYWRSRQDGKRDSILNRTLFVTKKQYCSLLSNPFRIESTLYHDNYAGLKFDRPAIMTDRGESGNLYQLIGKTTAFLLTRYISAFESNSRICIICEQPFQLAKALFAVIPPPLRSITFSISASYPESSFRLFITYPEFLRFFPESQFDVIKLDCIRDSNSEQGARDKNALAHALGLVLASLVEKMPQVLEKIEQAFSSMEWNDLEIGSTCMLVLQTISKQIEAHSGHLGQLEEELLDLEREIVMKSSQDISTVMRLVYERGGLKSVIEMLAEMDLSVKTVRLDGFSSFLMWLIDLGKSNEANTITTYLIDHGQRMIKVNHLVKYLLKPCANDDYALSVICLLESLIKIGQPLDEELARSFSQWCETENSSTISPEINRLQAVVFESSASYRQYLFTNFPERFVSILSTAAQPRGIIQEIIDQSTFTVSEGISRLSRLVGMCHSTNLVTDLTTVIAGQLRALSPTEIINEENYSVLRTFPMNLRENVLTTWLDCWRVFLHASNEIAYLTMISAFLESDFTHDPKINDAIDQYAMTLLQEVKSFPHDTDERPHLMLHILAQSSPSDSLWSTKAFRNNVEKWLEFHWNTLHVSGKSVEEILSSLTKLSTIEVQNTSMDIGKISRGRDVVAINRLAKKTIERLAGEARSELISSLEDSVQAYLKKS